MDGRTDWRMGGWTDERTDGRTNGRPSVFQICDLMLQCTTDNAQSRYRTEGTRDESATNMDATQPVLPSGEILPSLIRPGRVFS